jgi:hypothetical protein
LTGQIDLCRANFVDYLTQEGSDRFPCAWIAATPSYPQDVDGKMVAQSEGVMPSDFKRYFVEAKKKQQEK